MSAGHSTYSPRTGIGRWFDARMPLPRLPGILRESMVLVGGILVILGLSMASTSYLIDARVPQELFETVQGFVDDRWTFLLLLTVFLLVVGTMLDVFSATVLIVPLIVPVALAYGIHPAHLGILFLATLPFFLLLLGATVAITFWPALSLWLID